MKQELFKDMYRQIHLDKEQKDRIWRRLEAAPDSPSPDDYVHKNAGKRFGFSTRAAVCASVLLVSGMTVFAANEFFLMDRLANAMKLLTQNEQELTEEQKNIYVQYGTALDNEVVGTNGTFRLEAVLYDENFLFVPFQYIFNSDTAGYKNITAGFTFEETNMWDSKLLVEFRQDYTGLWYGVSQDSRQARGISGSITVLNPEIDEDGVLTGSLLLSVEKDKTFRQGDVIQIVRKEEQSEVQERSRWLETASDEILTEFTLRDAVEQHSISIPTKQAEALGQLGLSMEQLTVSSISLHFSGILKSVTPIPYSGAVVLKDGSTVEPSATGGSSSSLRTTEQGEMFSWSQLFAAPIQVEEISGIRIHHETSEVWIPVEW